MKTSKGTVAGSTSVKQLLFLRMRTSKGSIAGNGRMLICVRVDRVNIKIVMTYNRSKE